MRSNLLVCSCAGHAIYSCRSVLNWNLSECALRGIAKRFLSTDSLSGRQLVTTVGVDRAGHQLFTFQPIEYKPIADLKPAISWTRRSG